MPAAWPGDGAALPSLCLRRSAVEHAAQRGDSGVPPIALPTSTAPTVAPVRALNSAWVIAPCEGGGGSAGGGRGAGRWFVFWHWRPVWKRLREGRRAE